MNIKIVKKDSFKDNLIMAIVLFIIVGLLLFVLSII
jgi:hypothetical protein